MSYNREEQQTLNNEALIEPMVGDYWHEMYSPYFIIVNRSPLGEKVKYTVLSCIGNDNARLMNEDDTWSFDYSKHIEVDWNWISDHVLYKGLGGFVADVARNDKMKKIVQEWKKFQAERLLRELKDLGPEVSQIILQAEW